MRMSIACKRVGAGLLAGICAALCMSAAAEPAADQEKTLIMASDGVTGSIQATSDTATFWELPQLPAGQLRTHGKLTVFNSTDRTAKVRLVEIELPYGDEEALTYLNALTLTVKQGDTVLYDGPYVRVGDWKPAEVSLLPEERLTWDVTLRCAFSYTGEAAVGSPIVWNFDAALTGDAPNQLQQPEQPVLAAVLLGIAVAAILACAIIGGIRWMRRRA